MKKAILTVVAAVAVSIGARCAAGEKDACACFGGAVIASFLTACATVSLLFVISAVAGFVYALFTGFTVRHMTGRVARSAIIYVMFMAICAYWGVVLL